MTDSTRPASLDQLIALNDEMAALVRAGVPLDRGLVHLGEDAPGRLGRLADEIGRRLQDGESLADVVGATERGLPPLYQAVVQAGIRSGNLAVALQEFSTTLRRVSDVRKLVGLALLYPLLLLGLAYAVGLLAVSTLLPALMEFRQTQHLSESWWLKAIVAVGDSSAYWWPWPPLLMLVACGALWWFSGSYRASSSMFGRLRPFGHLLRSGRLAAFAEILKMLLHNDVSLVEALPLAAEASGDATLQTSARELSQRLQRGEQLRTMERLAGFPPLLFWLISTGSSQRQLIRALGEMSSRYRARLRRRSEWLTVYLPIVLSAGVGGVAVAVLAIGTLGPWLRILLELGVP